MGNFKYLNSIRFKIAIVVLLTTAFVVFSTWFVSNSLVEQYYITQVKSTMVETYENCNDFFNDDGNMAIIKNYEIGSLYGYIDNPSNAAIFVVDTSTLNVYTTVNMNSDVSQSLFAILDNYDFSVFDDLAKKYKIVRNSVIFESEGSVDSANDSDEYNPNGIYYDLIGLLDNGYVIVLRTPVEFVHNNVSYVTQLFLGISVVLLLLEVAFVLLFSNSISRPIIEMSHIARRMANLDFSAKVNVRTSDEIGDLGNSMNNMSARLEKSISELKEANIELAKDIEEKEKLEEMRSEFLSHVSHELKTPIALIQGYSEGLKDGITDDPESTNFYCDVIIDEATKMNALVMKLINLNELEFGEDKPDIVQFDITGLIGDVINASGILIDKAETRVTFDEPRTLVWADEFMTEQVVTNYLTNAIHYVKPGGEIRVWYEQRERSLRVNVFNEGSQLSDEALERVFIKFYKEDAARTREYGGSGIGLSIVAAIMKSHNQDYGVYNTDNGVVFYFELDNTSDTERFDSNHPHDNKDNDDVTSL